MKTKEKHNSILSANTFPVIGIGASAGGLDAFKKLVKAIPEVSGMAYVLVQHLDPTHSSLLPELLQKVTTIPVLEISDEIKVLPDHIYIIPSNKMLMATDGVLKLSPRPEKSKNQPNLPIDLFFSSLAEIHRTHAIGVVLSGTASDGTKGLKAIKDQGGITFAQDEASAAYDGMPNSAVRAGVVDYILPPEEIPEKLLDIKKQIDRSDKELPNIPAPEKDAFKKILSLLRTRKGTDFTYYKQPTIHRRILRRMALNKNEGASMYLEYLQKNHKEQDALYNDLLIPVTSFFRDHKVFDNLCETVFPQIIKNKAVNAPIRVWVAGCSTGQEAYSLAICLKEFLGDDLSKVQIFATDISEPAIAKARTGIYSKSELEDIGTHRLQEFFTKVDEGYHIDKELRNMCVFAVHNFLKDPPFGKIDLVSCRNVLIYMEPYLQKKALTTFHYALNLKGFLLLGKSETSGSAPELFASAVKGEKLFTCKDVPRRFMYVASLRSEQSLHHLNNDTKTEKQQTDFQITADEIILSKFTPASVVVNEVMDIVHFRGNTSDYLEQGAGKPSHNLLKMAKDGLAFDLRTVFNKMKKENKAVLKDNIHVQIAGVQHNISIEGIPLPNMADIHYLIIFHTIEKDINTTAQTSGKASQKHKKDAKDLRIEQLEKEIVQMHEGIRSITKEQEAANEELQSANEELVSGSEEFQSLNEELEASREELQCTNEELNVLNHQLSTSNEQVTAAKDYAESIVATIREPLLVLDKDLRIKTANSAFYKAFKVNAYETEGVSIYDLGNKQWNIPMLRKLLEENLPRKTNFIDFEVKHDFSLIGERTMLLSAREMTGDNAEEKLILLAIEDITERKRHQIKDQLHAKELETQVQKRTHELSEANDKLLQKNDELEKMNRELESFSYISSHDLQEPLRKVQAFASLILQKEYAVLSDKGKDYFNRMNNAANRMQTLIQDLLTYSHTNIKERKFEPTELVKIVNEIKEDLNDAILEKKAVIETDKLGNAIVNIFQFRQVISNLISNALKFSKPDVPAHISLESEIKQGSLLENETIFDQVGKLSPDKNYCHIIFKDNGIGFDPKYKDQIFVVFQRLHSKEEFAGTGIGLAIVKKIIDNHKGFIVASSKVGHGARFDIYIPDY